MAKPYFIGGATAVAQEDRLTPGGSAIEVGDKFLITLRSEDNTTQVITATATGTTVAQVCADLLTAWNASTATLKSGITASNQTTYFRLTGTAGVPFYATPTTTESDDSPADDQTFTRTATTANAGPADWGTAANWSTGAVPVSTDEVTLDGRMANAITYGLYQSGVTLAKLTLVKGRQNVGTASYPLAIGATSCKIGVNPDDGSNPTDAAITNLNFLTIQTFTEIYSSRNTGTSGQPPITLKGTHASNALTIYGGIASIARINEADTATMLTINANGGTLHVAAGTTWTTINVNNTAAKVYTYGAGTTLVVNSGLAETDGSGLIGTITANGGTVNINNRASGDDVTTLNARGGTIDFRGDAAAAVVNALNYRSGTIYQPAGGVTFTGTTLDFNGATSITLSPG